MGIRLGIHVPYPKRKDVAHISACDRRIRKVHVVSLDRSHAALMLYVSGRHRPPPLHAGQLSNSTFTFSSPELQVRGNSRAPRSNNGSLRRLSLPQI
jgi:hypothetical protein